jgi:hypothetical protein
MLFKAKAHFKLELLYEHLCMHMYDQTHETDGAVGEPAKKKVHLRAWSFTFRLRLVPEAE